LAAVLALPPAVGAAGDGQVYFYRDRNGVMHFTDAPVDEKFKPFKITATVYKVGHMGGARLAPETIRPFINQAASRYRLEPSLILAVIKAESAFNPKAVSWAGARGLMQLMPQTADMLGVADSFDARQNILGGSRYLRMMMDQFGDLKLALAAYNAGPHRVTQAGGIPNIRETRNYVKRVLRYYRQYKSQTS
jgi:soluble lytic murein transglycosylase-like protein